MSETFGQRLRRLRCAAGLSQSQLARLVPISQSSLSRSESDTQAVDDQAVAARLDELLGAAGTLRALAYPNAAELVLTDDDRERIARHLEHPSRIDGGTVTALGDLLAAQRRLDDVLGPEIIIPGSISQMEILRGLLPHARGPHRAALAEVVADSAANVLVPSVVDRSGLSSASSKLQATEIVGQTFAGGPLGSLTFAVFAAFPFLLTSASFSIGAALMVALAGSFRPERPASDERPNATLRTDLVDGMRWLFANPTMWRLVIAAGGLALTSELAQAQLVLYALEDLELTEAAFGVFGLVGGVGGLAGAAVASRLVDRFRARYVLAGGMGTSGVAFLAMGVSGNPVVSAVLFGVFAAAVVVANVLFATVRYRLVPEELLGRVLGVWRTVVWGMLPVGALLGGWLTTLLGTTSATFAFSGACQVALAVVALVAAASLARRLAKQA
ncbi:hypothetical protein ACZ91_06640 [Streptomyces regensis]|nr:hypothetical protein ACZ91_06640 [Streptomyces regensis]